MKITFLGTDSVLPVAGNDTASYLIDDETVIDTGFAVYATLRRAGADLSRIRRVLLTHLHHDHMIGLPGLIFGVAHGHPDRGHPLEIYGPQENLEEHVRRAKAYLWLERFPLIRAELETHPLQPGDSFMAGPYQVNACALQHPIASMAYRFDLGGRRMATICGDTLPCEALVEFARGSELLIHEASLAGRAPELTWGHSTATQAATLARSAGVGRLALVHLPPSQAQVAQRDASAVFANVFLPQPGEVVEVA